MGCVWHKEAQLDNWSLKECWPYPVGGGVVTAAWTSHQREVSASPPCVRVLLTCAQKWVVSETGTSSRLPPLGPVPPFANPLLLVVTEAHLLHVYSLSPYAKAPVPMRAPLLQPIDPIQQPASRVYPSWCRLCSLWQYELNVGVQRTARILSEGHRKNDCGDTCSSRRLPMDSNRSLGTGCRGTAGTGAGAAGAEVIVQMITNASCCLTAAG